MHMKRKKLTPLVAGVVALVMAGPVAAQAASAPAESSPTTAQAAAAASGTTLWWRAPSNPVVNWRGMLPTDSGEVKGGPFVLYPAIGGLAGLLGTVVGHSLGMAGAQALQRKREQEKADAVLEPYAATLQAWPAAALWEQARERASATVGVQLLNTEAAAATPAAWVLQTEPAFTLSGDEAAVVLDLAVQLTQPGLKEPLTLFVRVVSSPVPMPDPPVPLPAQTPPAHAAGDLVAATVLPAASAASAPAAAAPATAASAAAASPPPAPVPAVRAHWVAEEGRQLKTVAAGMLAHALTLVHRHGLPGSAGEEREAPSRTQRYVQGAVERTERAQVLRASCDRAVLRNLRGWLMSVPLLKTPETPCKDVPTF
jgi:hypothetical protein